MCRTQKLAIGAVAKALSARPVSGMVMRGVCVAARFRPGYTSTPMRVGLVVIACVCLSAACGKSASPQVDNPAPNGDLNPAAACSLPCRVVVSGLTRPTEMTAGGGYVYFVERGNREDTYDGVVMRAPAKGGAAETLTAAPGILGLFMNRTSLFWQHLQPVAADYSYAIATVPNTGGTPANLLQLPSTLGPVGADDVAVYGVTHDELLAVSLADRTKRTLAQVWGIASVSITGSTLTMTNRGHAMPPESTLSDPAGTAPCLVSASRLCVVRWCLQLGISPRRIDIINRAASARVMGSRRPAVYAR
jgi:hypothetical protein